MTLIVVKNKKFLNIPFLQRLVLKSIYAPKTMTHLERTEMENSIQFWYEHIKLKKSNQTMNAVDEENEVHLQEMAWLIRENDEGRLEGRKEMFRKHQIDWRKFHKLEEAFKPEDFVKGQELIDESNKREGINEN